MWLATLKFYQHAGSELISERLFSINISGSNPKTPFWWCPSLLFPPILQNRGSNHPVGPQTWNICFTSWTNNTIIIIFQNFRGQHILQILWVHKMLKHEIDVFTHIVKCFIDLRYVPQYSQKVKLTIATDKPNLQNNWYIIIPSKKTCYIGYSIHATDIILAVQYCIYAKCMV